MFSLPEFSRKQIEEHIDQLFDLMSYWVLGTIPHGEKAKTIVFGTQPPNVTLANLFVQALRNNKPNLKEEDALKGMLRNANNYINGIRERTKAKAIAGLESYIAEQKKTNSPIDYKTASEVLKQEMDKSKKDMLDVVSGESQRIKGIGTALDIKKVAATQGIDDPTIFFVVMRDEHVCKYCIKNHLLEDGITPRVFKMSEVKSGYLTKEDREKGEVSLSLQHPHCRCSLTTIFPSYGFKNGKVSFIGLNHDEWKRQRGLE